MVSLSISVVLYRTPTDQLDSFMDSLFNSIRALRERHSLPSIPIFLVDNFSESGSSSCEIWARKYQPERIDVDFHYLAGHGNIGYGRGHNLVLGQLDSDYHLLLNPDVTFDKEALNQAITILHNNKHLKLLSPSATGLDGSKQYLCKRYPSLLTLLIRGFFSGRFEKHFNKRLFTYEMRELSEDEYTEGIFLASGCFMLVDTLAWKEVSGFDEKFFLYFEDFDLSLRMGKCGKFVYAPSVRIMHAGGFASSKGLRHLYAFTLSGIRFFSKHGWRFL